MCLVLVVIISKDHIPIISNGSHTKLTLLAVLEFRASHKFCHSIVKSIWSYSSLCGIYTLCMACVGQGVSSIPADGLWKDVCRYIIEPFILAFSRHITSRAVIVLMGWLRHVCIIAALSKTNDASCAGGSHTTHHPWQRTITACFCWTIGWFWLWRLRDLRLPTTAAL